MATTARAVSLPVGIYARISSDREGDELGVKRQQADCERLARFRGWEVADYYVDDDTSAWSGRRRPQYERLLVDLRLGAVRGVVVWHLDRLTRHPRELEAFMDLADELHVELACVTGDVDIATHSGRLTARMLGGLANYESAHKSERITRKHEELAQRGKISGGGPRPYGYEEDKKTVRPSEAAVIKECARRVLAGESLRSIVFDLNERGDLTAAGKQWSSSSLRRVLNSARIAGQREHHGEVVAKAEWPAIISPAQSAKLRALFSDPSRRTTTAVRSYLLTGILTCGRCGMKLVARPRAGGDRRYACASDAGGCGKTYIKADDVERELTKAVLARLDSRELVDALQGRRRAEPDAARWLEEERAAQKELDELATLRSTNQITTNEWLIARKPFTARVAVARKQLAKATGTSVLEQYVGNAAALREQWDDLDLSVQHSIVAEVVDHVEVGPGRPGYNRFDRGRLTPFWRP